MEERQKQQKETTKRVTIVEPSKPLSQIIYKYLKKALGLLGFRQRVSFYLVILGLIGSGFLKLALDVSNFEEEYQNIFLSSMAATLSTSFAAIDMGSMPQGGRIVLGFLMVLGSPILLSLVPLLVRRHAFRKQVEKNFRAQLAEYVALRTMFRIVLIYYFAVQILGTFLLGVWASVNPDAQEILKSRNQTAGAWAVFHTISAFNSVGLSTFSDSMVAWDTYAYPLLVLVMLTLLGNTAFPLVLRLIVYILYRFSKKETLVYKFILDNPRHCFTHLFLQKQTLWLLLTIIALNTFETAAFLAMNWNLEILSHYTPGEKILNSFFSAVVTRNSGYYSIPLSTFPKALLVLYMGMAYISSIPVIATVRATNISNKNPDGSIQEPEPPIQNNEPKTLVGIPEEIQLEPPSNPTSPSQSFSDTLYHSSESILPKKTQKKKRKNKSSTERNLTMEDIQEAQENDENIQNQNIEKEKQEEKIDHQSPRKRKNRKRRQLKEEKEEKEEEQKEQKDEFSRKRKNQQMDEKDGHEEFKEVKKTKKKRKPKKGESQINKKEGKERKKSRKQKVETETEIEIEIELNEIEEENFEPSNFKKLKNIERYERHDHDGNESYIETPGKKKGKEKEKEKEREREREKEAEIERERSDFFIQELQYLQRDLSGNSPLVQSPPPIDSVSYQARSLLSSYTFILYTVFFIICIIERERIVEDPENFNAFNIAFEILSAYGTVGLTVGYPGTYTCFSRTWEPFAKVLLIFIALLGRYRNLPSSIDHAVMIPVDPNDNDNDNDHDHVSEKNEIEEQRKSSMKEKMIRFLNDVKRKINP